MKIEQNSTYAVDTNILIYAFDANDAKKNTKAKQLLKNAFDGKVKLIVTNQILAEFVSVATTKLTPPLTGEEVSRFLRSVQSSYNWEILNYTTKDIIGATGQKHFWDALIAATLKTSRVTLLTENTRHFDHIDINVQNPFT